MTREEILANYKVSSRGIIVSPGQFEGEPVYAPYYWEMVMDGGGDETEYEGDSEDANPVDIFYLDDEDREQWPELGDAVVLALWSDSNGFIHTELRW